jgi:hypothetical protein
MRRTLAGLAALLALSASARAADGDLKTLAATLASVRATHGMNYDRDAGPELTPVKQQLRAWIETRMPARADEADLAALTRQLNGAIEAAGLTCGAPRRGSTRCEDSFDDIPSQQDARGFLGDVEVSARQSGRYLVVKTDVGVRCGYDESAYVYERRGASWALLLQSEQDRYGDKDYHPQNFLAIDISPARAGAKPPLVLTLGLSPWCSSNWQMIYARLWRAAPTSTTPRPLLDTAEEFYLDDDSVSGSRLTDNDVLFEYHGNSIDNTVLIRPHVMHYRVLDGDRIERVQPVALNPQDFVDEFLSHPWDESARWIDPSADSAALAGWHRALRKGPSRFIGEFDGDATRCAKDVALWQVGLRADNAKSDLDPPLYFFVRELGSYQFMLEGIGPRPRPDCTIKVAQKKTFDTLFPRRGER